MGLDRLNKIAIGGTMGLASHDSDDDVWFVYDNVAEDPSIQRFRLSGLREREGFFTSLDW